MRLTGEIRFGENDAVGERRLAARLVIAHKSLGAEHGIESRGQGCQPIAAEAQGIAHQGLQNGSGIGKARGLDDHTGIGRQFPDFAPVEQRAQRPHKIATGGTAEAATLEQDRILLHRRLDQQMVEADLAELVDHDSRAGEFAIPEQGADQGRLATAEKAGEYGNGNRGLA